MTDDPWNDVRSQGELDDRRYDPRSRPWAVGATRPAATDVPRNSFFYDTDDNVWAFSDGTDWISMPGTEIAYYSTGTDVGPTGVTTTGNGDAIFEFGDTTTENVKYYFEMWLIVQSSAGNEVIFFRFNEGTSASPGTLIEEFNTRTPTTNPGPPHFFRVPFTPSAGTRGYAVRWRGGAGTYTIVNSQVPISARIVKA